MLVSILELVLYGGHSRNNMLSKTNIFDIIEQMLLNNLKSETDDCSILADAIVERLDEEGLWDSDSEKQYD